MLIYEIPLEACTSGSNAEALLKRALEIHDRMPVDWEPSHQGSQTNLERIRADVAAKPSEHRIWLLSETAEPDPSRILGILWAVIKKKPPHDEAVCCINSFWIDSEHRRAKHSLAFGERCRSWVASRGVREIECSTHFTNRRMQEILDKIGFQPTYISYSLKV